ncbi:MAG: AAA family ATPase, partial [Bacteroidetes bacterium]|nr:AAA family ATPase [Bacteroidota bacterium]
MIKSLHIENLKGFEYYDVTLDSLNLLIGGNNSGKTTIFQALQLSFWCMEQIKTISGDDVIFTKTQKLEIDVIPYVEMRDLFFNQRVRTGKSPTHIKIGIETTVGPRLDFDIFQVFGRNLKVDGFDKKITRKDYDAIYKLKPKY